MQDYAAKTLPSVMGGVIRIPGFLGAPQALVGDSWTLSGFDTMEPDFGDIADSLDVRRR